ncbi:ABC transporter substrate-binding protein, partial [Chloroflexota bacterium]
VEKPRYGGTILVPLDDMDRGFDDVYGPASRMFALHLTQDSLFVGAWGKGPSGTGECTWYGGGLDLNAEEPALVETWDVPDANTIIFHIRKGVRWHNKPPMNGRELTAEDVAYNINRWWQYKTSSMVKNFRGWLESATATDKYTVVVKGHNEIAGTATVFFYITKYFHILPPDVIEQYGDMLDWRNVVGTGPFELVDYVTGSANTLKRNPNYWKSDPFHPDNKLPYADTVIQLIILEPSTRLAALRTGKVDYLNNILADDAALLQKTNPELKWTHALRDQGWLIYTRIDSKPFDDVRVRRALQMAINNKEIADEYYDGAAELLWHPVPPVPDFSREFIPLEEMPQSIKELFEYHPEKAKQLLTEAGYPNGFETSVICQDMYVDILSIVKDYWAKIGVDLKLDVKEPTVATSIQRGFTYEQMFVKYRSAGGVYKVLEYTPGSAENLSLVDIQAINERINKVTGFELWRQPEERAKLIREHSLDVLENAYLIQLPNPMVYSVWWPWVKSYSGEYQPGFGKKFGWPVYPWVDQDMKESMIGKR